MVNSIVRRENNFPTGKLLALSIIGILIFLAQIPSPCPSSMQRMRKQRRVRNKNKKTKVKTKVPTSSQGGISINGCSDTKGSNGGIVRYWTCKGSMVPMAVKVESQYLELLTVAILAQTVLMAYRDKMGWCQKARTLVSEALEERPLAVKAARAVVVE